MTAHGARVDALRDVVTDAENLVESLTAAADLSKPDTAERLRGWRVPIEALRHDAYRQAQSLEKVPDGS